MARLSLPRRLSAMVSGPYQEDEAADLLGAPGCAAVMAAMFILALVLIVSSAQAQAEMHRACAEAAISTTAECGEMLRGGL